MSEFDAKAFVESLPSRPGVYRMLDGAGTVLYVGKAGNLRSRVASYFRPDQLHPKVAALVRGIRDMEVTVTNSETEALILEFNLIKRHKPRYNILLRDDKSFPYLHFSAHEYPRLGFHRGSRQVPGQLFGPYPNARAAREIQHQLHKLFRLRGCQDSFFSNRTRPCLEYQIRRCSGPCVGLISREDYADDVAAAAMVLRGKSAELAARIRPAMEQAANRLEFERAAVLRNQLAALAEIQAQQVVSSTADAEADVVAIATAGAEACVAVMFVRGGRNLGTTHYFPRAPLEDPAGILSGFLSQYYLAREAPPEILTSAPVPDAGVLAAALSERAGRRVTVRHARRSLKARWVELARDNAATALAMRIAARASVAEQLEVLAAALGLKRPPRRIECFDVSHTRGEAAVAACVAFGPEGALKQEYRRYNIAGVVPGDDYGALRQALSRRFRREPDGEDARPLPDLLLLDGGPVQVSQAGEVLAESGIELAALVGIAKGAERRPGQERLFLLGHKAPLILRADSKALHLIQRVRDEAHRFAISGHRRSRGKARRVSPLEGVPGFGPARRRELLRHFGGLQGVMRAGVEDLMAVKGLSRKLAETLYGHLHQVSR